MLFETTVAILMAGLMTHVGNDTIAGEDPKTHVMMARDRTNAAHTPVLWVLTNKLSEIIYLKPGDKIRFENLVKGTAKAQPDFQSYTPSLAEPISHGFLSDAARKNERDRNFFASMEYPEGKLSILFYHNNEANFLRRNRVVRHQCVPRFTLFLSEKSNKDHVRMYIEPSHQGYVELTGGALIFLINQPLHRGPVSNAKANEHFANYGSMVKRRNLVTWPRLAAIEEGDPCGRPAEQKLPDDIYIDDIVGGLSLPAVALNFQKLATDSSGQKALFHILLSANPSCTNTDWP